MLLAERITSKHVFGLLFQPLLLVLPVLKLLLVLFACGMTMWCPLRASVANGSCVIACPRHLPFHLQLIPIADKTEHSYTGTISRIVVVSPSFTTTNERSLDFAPLDSPEQ